VCSSDLIPAVLVGDGQLREELEGEYPEARFLGSLSYSDVADAFSAARAFALASTDETEGLAAMEAMAAGAPVAYSRIPILEEKIGRNGIAFSSEDSLKSALSRLFESRALCRKLSSRGRKAAQRYDIRRCTKKIVAVYEKVSKK
jgi:glycosyltransferase involved in cell wall biosynthesis